MSSLAHKTPHYSDDLAELPTASTAPRILVADDDDGMCEMAAAGLTQRGYRVTTCSTPDAALAKLDAEDFAVMVAAIHMDGQRGPDLCRAPAAKRPDLPVIVMTGFGTVEHAVGA